MTPCFADTFFFLALLNEDDEAHERAVSARDSGRPILTTGFVLIELGDHLCGRRNRSLFVELYALLERSRGTELVPVSDELAQRGRELYRDRPDKDWSLTDCISFLVMTERRIDRRPHGGPPLRAGRLHGLAEVSQL